jgi:hypothetical protein
MKLSLQLLRIIGYCQLAFIVDLDNQHCLIETLSTLILYALTAKTLYLKFKTNIPINEEARSRSLYSCFGKRFIIIIIIIISSSRPAHSAVGK